MADNKAYQKKANISLVMQTIRVENEISRIEISRKLGLDRSTITNIVSKLIEEGLIIEKSQGFSVSKGGRKPVYLGINPGFGLILGLELQVNFYRATLMCIDGSIIWNKSVKTNTIKDIYNELSPSIKKCNSPLLGVGIGIPGHIDPIEGLIKETSPFYPFRSEISELSTLFSVPVVLDNDANCCAWGVLEGRKGAGLKNFLYSIVESHGNGKDRDIGFGIVINGDVYYGSNFAAGEIGECLVKDKVNEIYFEKLFEKLSLYIAFLNPSHLFLGGEFLNYRDEILVLVKKSSFHNKCEVVFSELCEYEVSYGASSMFIERLFKIPGIERTRISDLTWEKIINSRKQKVLK